jgi:hypothetical protein
MREVTETRLPTQQNSINQLNVGFQLRGEIKKLQSGLAAGLLLADSVPVRRDQRHPRKGEGATG